MSFLGIFDFCFVLTWAWRQIFLPKDFFDDVPTCSNSTPFHLGAVGTHIGDKSYDLRANRNTFIKFLGELHGSSRAKAEFPRGFLLEGRGNKRRTRMALESLFLDCINMKVLGSDFFLCVSCILFRSKTKFVQFFPIQMGEACLKRLLIFC